MGEDNKKLAVAFFAAGVPALKEAMKENQKQFPLKKFTVKHAIVEADMVTVHSHTNLDNEDKQFAVVHIFRFQNGKIIEMWDIGQEIPKDLPNKDGIF